MKISRSTAVTAAAAAAAALAATGVTYAAAASAPEAAPAAAPAAVASAPLGGGTSNNNSGNNNNTKGNEGKGNEGHEGGREHRGGFEGRIEINERSYSAHPGDCITVVSGLGARTLNIRNDSHKTVEVFRGAVCDNGAPVAVVGPHSQSDGVGVRRTGDVKVKDGVIGSFRVVCDHGWGGWGGGRGGDWGGDGGDWGGRGGDWD
ncbi:hypothetical protein [Streptomyces sp. NPDC048192]|jgi:hypothetical protein|uniref:hypothetical protein n=1 Tax=Streptomyces sp. NPDC048192 TaxID=3365510 RepID=UPI00372409CF